jgi:hypothetical protein
VSHDDPDYCVLNSGRIYSIYILIGSLYRASVFKNNQKQLIAVSKKNVSQVSARAKQFR